MSDLIEKVYIDQGQCELFGVEYFGSCGLQISVRELKNSKRYDEAHNKLFDTYYGRYFFLRREEGDPPGWYSWAVFN